jgi:DNA invertase Pin-like site-specific DNA recombinase
VLFHRTPFEMRLSQKSTFCISSLAQGRFADPGEKSTYRSGYAGCTKRHPRKRLRWALRNRPSHNPSFGTFRLRILTDRGFVLYAEKYSMKIALYGRVSTQDKGQNPENQLLQLRQFCRQQGWEIVGEYVDEKTGRNSNREAFQRLFQDAYQKQFEMVLFWALDRFSREGATDTLAHLRKLSSYGVQWKSYTEQYIDSAGMFGEVIISLLAVLAKQESVRRSERASAAYARLKQQGRTDHLGRKRLVVDRCKIIEMATGGMSTREVAAKLKISHTSVHRIVQGKA